MKQPENWSCGDPVLSRAIKTAEERLFLGKPWFGRSFGKGTEEVFGAADSILFSFLWGCPREVTQVSVSGWKEGGGVTLCWGERATRVTLAATLPGHRDSFPGVSGGTAREGNPKVCWVTGEVRVYLQGQLRASHTPHYSCARFCSKSVIGTNSLPLEQPLFLHLLGSA